MKGVVRCIVGYSGGRERNPTYQTIKDHTEALLIEFDPTQITYEDLLIEWSRMHSPLYKSKCQYRSAVWYVNEEQKEAAEEVLRGMKATARGQEIHSSVEKATRFYQAEDYHQNFMSRQYGAR